MSDLRLIMEPVARKLLGEPNQNLSNGGELRFGSKGSVAVDLDKGTWFDHENKEGGGVIKLIEREVPGEDPRDWLKREGYDDGGAPASVTYNYDYKDEGSKLLYQTVRTESAGKKKIWQRRPDDSGGWIGGKGALKGVRRVPYRLPELIGSGDAEVYVPEGEKKVEALRRLRLVATCNVCGANNWRDDYNKFFKDRDVLLMPDNDTAGRSHVEKIARHLRGIAKRVRVLVLPGLEEKGDILDWLDAGGTGEELRRLADAAPEWSPTQPDGEDDADKDITEVNRSYALVLAGGKAVVMKLEGGTKFRLLAIDAFKQWLANRSVYVNEKSVPLAKYWLTHPQRRQYEGIEFAPDAGQPGYYNLWHGFAVVPSQGDCSKFLGHLHDNVASGDEELYQWIVAWFAQSFQRPGEKLDTSLCLRGEMGVGKTKVGEVFGSLLGEHYALVSDARYITGQFNSHMASLLLLHADEAFWAGDKRGEGKLKDLVSGKQHFIEFKRVDPIRVANYLRLFVTGNRDWMVPAGFGERRFAVVDVGDEHMQDHPYFAAIDAEMNSGGREALLYHLLNFDLSSVNLRVIPKTAALLDQKIASATPEQAWWLDTLTRGELPWGTDELDTCLKTRLFSRA
jgi:hypothetical protein